VASKRDGRSRHEQIAAHLRALIMSGDLATGTQLPSTQQLVERYDAAGTTIQRALGVLKDEGFLTSRVGKGVYVRDRVPFVVRVGSYFTPSARGYSYRLLDVAEVHPPADVARVLDLGADGTAILRHRLMLYTGEPVSVFWSYYPVEIARNSPLAGRAKIAGGAPHVLAEIGYPQLHFEDRVSARPPTTEELEALEIPDNVPVIRQFRVVYSEGERPVEVSVQIKGAHRYELLYRETIEQPLDS
jgi:GntR family transcriptional regulator